MNNYRVHNLKYIKSENNVGYQIVLLVNNYEVYIDGEFQLILHLPTDIYMVLAKIKRFFLIDR